MIVASLGGFSSDGRCHARMPELYERVAESLQSVDEEGVEIIPQTLPPFPWYLGGQLFCNLFVNPDDTVRFAREYSRRLCLDVAHTKLACNHHRRSLSELSSAAQ